MKKNTRKSIINKTAKPYYVGANITEELASQMAKLKNEKGIPLTAIVNMALEEYFKKC